MLKYLKGLLPIVWPPPAGWAESVQKEACAPGATRTFDELTPVLCTVMEAARAKPCTRSAAKNNTAETEALFTCFSPKRPPHEPFEIGSVIV
jgi:hypothetical protein